MVDAIASLIGRDSQFVFDAVYGKKDSAQTNGLTPKTSINYRDEPVAFFFVLFGIVIEALVGGSSNPADTLKILSALKKILSPSVAGNAIFQDAIFSETVESFDRLALTEGLAAQSILVDIAKALCITHPSAVEDGSSSSDLSDDIEQLFELARIIVLVLTNTLPNIADPKSAPKADLADGAVSLIRNGFEALVEASAIFPSIIKFDLYATILHVFATILGTPACQAAAVPQTLPIFRRFVQRITTDGNQAKSSSLRAQIRTFLHRLLAILTVAQRREHESSLTCAKSVLLTISVVFTTASDAIPADEPLLYSSLDSTLDCLRDLGLAKVAASCLRSLLLTPSSRKNDDDVSGEAIKRYIFPRLVVFVANRTDEQDPENARGLGAQALTAFVTAAYRDNAEQAAAAAMAVVLPALLCRAQIGGKGMYQDTAARILELAQGGLLPAFRDLVAAMEPGMRGLMEGVIREGGGAAGRGEGRGDGDGGGEGGGEPSIALKLSFGG